MMGFEALCVSSGGFLKRKPDISMSIERRSDQGLKLPMDDKLRNLIARNALLN